MEADGEGRGSTVIQPFLCRKRCRQRPFGRSHQLVRARSHTRMQGPVDWKNPTGPPWPNLAVCGTFAHPQLLGQVWSLLCRGCSRHEPADGSATLANQWGPLGANDPGRPGPDIGHRKGERG